MRAEWIFICSHYNEPVKDSDPWHRRNDAAIFPVLILSIKPFPRGLEKNLLLSLSIKWEAICIMKKHTNNSIVFWSSFYKAFAWDLILPSKPIRFPRLCWKKGKHSIDLSSYLVQVNNSHINRDSVEDNTFRSSKNNQPISRREPGEFQILIILHGWVFLFAPGVLFFSTQ